METEYYLGDLPLWSDDEARAILNELCEHNAVPLDVFEDLVRLQREMQDKERAAGVYDAIAEILSRLD